MTEQTSRKRPRKPDTVIDSQGLLVASLYATFSPVFKPIQIVRKLERSVGDVLAAAGWPRHWPDIEAMAADLSGAPDRIGHAAGVLYLCHAWRLHLAAGQTDAAMTAALFIGLQASECLGWDAAMAMFQGKAWQANRKKGEESRALVLGIARHLTANRHRPWSSVSDLVRSIIRSLPPKKSLKESMVRAYLKSDPQFATLFNRRK